MPEKLSRADQARINGKFSKGPTSPNGKAKSSKNALKHGFAATTNVVIRLEHESEFDAHRAGFHASFKPKDYFELQLVDQLAAISWRQNRLVSAETALIDDQISIQAHAIAGIHPECCQDPYFHLAKAFQALSSSSINHHQQLLTETTTTATTGNKDEDDVAQLSSNIGSLELVRR